MLVGSEERTRVFRDSMYTDTSIEEEKDEEVEEEEGDWLGWT